MPRFYLIPLGLMFLVSTTLNSIPGSSLIADCAGYWIHPMLHSNAFPSHIRGHVIHSFLIFGPHQSLRADEYENATDHRASLGNIGLEWLVPSALSLASSWGVLLWFHVSRVYQGVPLSTLLLRPIFMFSYLHHRINFRNF